MSLFFDNDKSSPEPVYSPDEHVLSRLQSSGAEGSLLPPQQRGEFTVPFVTGLKIVEKTHGITSSTFTLAWDDVESDSVTVDHYNIYYTMLGTNTTQFIGPFTAIKSPAQITIVAPANHTVTFIVQTVLTNGSMSNLANCSSTTSVTDLSDFFGVGNDATIRSQTDGSPAIIVGSTTTTTRGDVTVGANQPNATVAVGSFDFANFNISAAEKRIAQIAGVTGAAVNTGEIHFVIWNAGTPATEMRITNLGLRLHAVAAYANNAAAAAGGLQVGDLYRTGADPDALCIVH